MAPPKLSGPVVAGTASVVGTALALASYVEVGKDDLPSIDAHHAEVGPVPMPQVLHIEPMELKPATVDLANRQIEPPPAFQPMQQAVKEWQDENDDDWWHQVVQDTNRRRANFLLVTNAVHIISESAEASAAPRPAIALPCNLDPVRGVA